MIQSEIPQLVARLVAGDRRALGKAITLVESTNAQDEPKADELLAAIMPRSGNSLRLGISGSPGVGKSSFIEAVGARLIAEGKKVAVLAIDPSSPVSGGSILGDKTRMEQLSISDRAFIRPSPSGDTSGGVARHTRESMLLCEAAGYDIIIVETVGVGQSDVVVASMVDYFVLLQQPYAGDELQGIKRGILELADMICVTKADGDSLEAAKRTKSELERAISFGYHHRESAAPLFLMSKESAEFIEAISHHLLLLASDAEFLSAVFKRRQQQAKSWFDQEIESFFRTFLKQARTSSQYRSALAKVEQLIIPASTAGRQFGRNLVNDSFK